MCGILSWAFVTVVTPCWMWQGRESGYPFNILVCPLFGLCVCVEPRWICSPPAALLCDRRLVNGSNETVLCIEWHSGGHKRMLNPEVMSTLQEICMVSQVLVHPAAATSEPDLLGTQLFSAEDGGMTATVQLCRASLHKCPRCWRNSSEEGLTCALKFIVPSVWLFFNLSACMNISPP